jgi:uncharacterized protein (DUF2384 family)
MSPDQIYAHCNEILVRQLGERLAAQWWGSPNHAFGDKTPAQLFYDAPVSVQNIFSHIGSLKCD